MNTGIYGDTSSAITRAGLRQADLSTRLEMSNKKKMRNKTQSVLYNSAMARSKGSLLDDTSVYSGNTGNGDIQNHNLNHNPNYNHNYNQNTQNLYTHQNFSQGYDNHGNINPNNYHMNYNNMQYQNNQQYPNYNQHSQYHQQQQPHQQHPQQQQYQNNPIIMKKQRDQSNNSSNKDSNYRESYMYLNQFNNNNSQTLAPNALQRISGSPNLNRRISGGNGSIIGSPIITTQANNEEQARKISFNALMGVKNGNINDNTDDNSMIDAINYMNKYDLNNNDDWESIDEENDIDYNNVENDETNNIIKRLQIENRGLKKKLKDIELGHDSNSIVADDEKYSRLEDEYNRLAESYLFLDNETKDLTVQNDSYFKDITKLRKELNELKENNNGSSDEILLFTKGLIDNLPNYISKTDDFIKIIGDKIPKELDDLCTNTLMKIETSKNNQSINTPATIKGSTLNTPVMGSAFTTPKLNSPNPNIGYLNDEEISKFLKDEVKQLNFTIKSLEDQMNKMRINYSTRIQEERQTIIVSTLQRKLHNEFINENPKNKNIGLKNFSIINIIPPNNNNTDNENENENENTHNSKLPVLDFNKEDTFISNLDSLTDSPTNLSLRDDSSNIKLSSLSPITPVSEAPESPKKRLTIYSTHTSESNDDFYSIASNNRISDDSLEIEFETFTT